MIPLPPLRVHIAMDRRQIAENVVQAALVCLVTSLVSWGVETAKKAVERRNQAKTPKANP